MARIAVFSSQAKGINVSITFQTRKTIANKAMPPPPPGGQRGTYRSQNEEEGGKQVRFGYMSKSQGPQPIYNSLLMSLK